MAPLGQCINLNRRPMPKITIPLPPATMAAILNPSFTKLYFKIQRQQSQCSRHGLYKQYAFLNGDGAIHACNYDAG